MNELTLQDNFSALFDSLKENRSGKLGEFQNQSFQKFQSLGLPVKKSESYKFTPIERILSKSFDFQSATPSQSIEEFNKHFYPIDDANHLVFVNGSFEEDFSVIKSSIDDLSIRLIDDSDTDLLGEISSQQNDTFSQFNGSLFHKGLYLKSLKNKQNKPVFIYQFINSNAGQVVVTPRILIVAEQGSSLEVYEKTITQGENNIFVNAILESDVASNAEVRFTKLQNYSKNVFTVEGIYASQKKDSRFYTNTYTFSGSLIRNNITIDIDGENCEGHMNGLYLISGNTHVDNNTSVDHKQPNSYSNELYKGVMDEKAHGVFNGKIYVRPEAQKTNAFQSNNNILLTDTAVINTKPQLEIWADDVKCSHGCTTGQLDEEAIFYLRSRGISKQRAKALMLNAFANETLSEVKSVLVKEEIEEIITNKLG
ncbi:MAG: Fe-S cluster assembly protein SufD [Cyclobacteriaceae bacterium]